LAPGQVDAAKQCQQREFIEGYFNLKVDLGPINRIYPVDASHPTHRGFPLQ
jgi:hypothetical protein